MSTEKDKKTCDRIDEIKNTFGYQKDAELCRWVGISRQTLNGWRKRGISAGGYEKLKRKRVSERWLRTGSGSMFVKQGEETKTTTQLYPEDNTVHEEPVMDSRSACYGGPGEEIFRINATREENAFIDILRDLSAEQRHTLKHYGMAMLYQNEQQKNPQGDV